MPAAKKAPSAAKKSASKRTMSDAHKQALAEGRTQGRAVRAYLEALESHKPKRGRKRTPESIAKRLDRIDQELATADPMKRLGLVQERLDLDNERAALGETIDLSALQGDFVAHAKTYSESKGISYSAWRAVGVPADVLKAAGIGRSAG